MGPAEKPAPMPASTKPSSCQAASVGAVIHRSGEDLIVHRNVVEEHESWAIRKTAEASPFVKHNAKAPDCEASSVGKSTGDRGKRVCVSSPPRSGTRTVACRCTSKEHRIVIARRVFEVKVPTWSASAAPPVVSVLPFETGENINGLSLESGDDGNSCRE